MLYPDEKANFCESDQKMIVLTRLDKAKVLVNVEAIKYVESTPDTLVSFLNGDTLIVLETLDEIRSRVVELKQAVLKSGQTGNG